MAIPNMNTRGTKSDRTARLLRVMHILYQNPNGIHINDIARYCGKSTRTVYRDLNALETELKYPIWRDNGQCGIVKGYFLPPVNFSLSEAITVFLAARLMLNYAHRYDPEIAATFIKLNSIVPSPLREQIQKTLDWMQRQKTNKDYEHIFNILTEAWVLQRTVTIHYQGLADKKAVEREIDPYFIEPAAAGHSSYVIAYCHRAEEIRTFKIERIKSISVSYDTYTIPADFDADAMLSSSWGIIAGGETESVVLRFSPDVSMLLEEVVWHPSQSTERQPDGSVIMKLTVANTVELQSWILGWRDKVEVLQPPALRQQIAEIAKAITEIY